MSYRIENLVTPTGLPTDKITLSAGEADVSVYTQGSTNELCYKGTDVTAQRPLEQQIVWYTDLFQQRGANPFMGPMAGRYGDEPNELGLPEKRVAQPGPVDIHGVFAGMPWKIEDIKEDEWVELTLTAEKWKGELKDYYYFAVTKPEQFAQDRQSLERLIRATKHRYHGDQRILSRIGKLEKLLKNERLGENLKTAESLVEDLVDFAFPGEADLRRRVTIEAINDNCVSFLDQVWMKNVSKDTDYRDASGYHTYFNTMLGEIIMPPGFWENGVVPSHYDDNLPNVMVRAMDQRERLERIVFLVPEFELKLPDTNQIIYRDQDAVEKSETAIECWRQRGDGEHYPEEARVIIPGETSRIGIRIIVVTGDELPDQIRNYLETVEDELTN